MCNLEYPDLDGLYERHRDRGLTVYGVASRRFLGGETDATLDAFQDQTQVSFPLLWDSGTYDAYDWPPALSPFPRQVLFDADGMVVYLAAEHDHRALGDAIERALPAEGRTPGETGDRL